MEPVNAGAPPLPVPPAICVPTLEQRLEFIEDALSYQQRRASERYDRLTGLAIAFVLGFALAMELTA